MRSSGDDKTAWWSEFSLLSSLPLFVRRTVFGAATIFFVVAMLLYSVPMSPLTLGIGILVLQSIEVLAFAVVYLAIYEFAYERDVVHPQVRSLAFMFAVGTIVADTVVVALF